MPLLIKRIKLLNILEFEIVMAIVIKGKNHEDEEAKEMRMSK